MSQSSKETLLFSPSENDWIVTLVTTEGLIINRRISPSTIDESTAVRYAMSASQIRISNLDSYSVRRASDRSLVANGDEFLAHLKSKKKD